MKTLGLAAIAATGVIAGALGAPTPALADIGHLDWILDGSPTVNVPHVPHVDTTVHHQDFGHGAGLAGGTATVSR
jgi:hypothetical protein